MQFVLLGYVLCYFEGVTDWTRYSQASIVPTDINGIHFANAGPFREHLSPVHGYDRFSFASRHGEFDVSDVSAGGGWTGGNVIMSPSSAAEWIFALYGMLTLFATFFSRAHLILVQQAQVGEFCHIRLLVKWYHELELLVMGTTGLRP